MIGTDHDLAFLEPSGSTAGDVALGAMLIAIMLDTRPTNPARISIMLVTGIERPVR